MDLILNIYIEMHLISLYFKIRILISSIIMYFLFETVGVLL